MIVKRDRYVIYLIPCLLNNKSYLFRNGDRSDLAAVEVNSMNGSFDQII